MARVRVAFISCARRRAFSARLSFKTEIAVRISGVIAAGAVFVETLGRGDESHFRLIVNVVAAIKDLRSLSRGVEQIAHRRHGAVVQIRGARPDAIERHVHIAVGLAEMTEAPGIAGVENVLRGRELFRVGIEPMAIGADGSDRDDFADMRAGEIAAALAVATRAIVRIERCAAGAQFLFDGEWIRRRLFLEQPLFHTAEKFEIDRGREGAGAEGGALVALFHHRVVAVPMRAQLHFFALSLEPDGGEIAETDQLFRRQFLQRKFKQRFRGSESVGAARALIRLPIEIAEMAAEHDEALAHEGQRVETHDHAIDEIVVAADGFDLGQDAIGGEALIERAGEDETLEGAEIDGVRRHPGVKRARFLGRLTHGADVADRAIEENTIDALRVAL